MLACAWGHSTIGRSRYSGKGEQSLTLVVPQRYNRSERLATAGLHRPLTAQIGCARECLWKACRSVAQGLEHEGSRGATGTEASVEAMERAMP